MFTSTRIKDDFSATITVNSVNDITPLICFKHNKLIVNISINGGFCNYITVKNLSNLQNSFRFDIYNNSTITIDCSGLIKWNNNQLEGLKIEFFNRFGIITGVTLRILTIDGKSYPLRPNISTDRQVISGDTNYINNFPLFVPFDCYLLYGNFQALPLLAGINYVDLSVVGHRFAISDDGHHNVFDNTFDYTFNGSGQHEYDVTVTEVCPRKNNYCVVEYINYLGENVKLLGYVAEAENDMEGTNFTRSRISNFNRQTKMNLETVNQTINVVFPNLHYTHYPTDIMLNETVKITVGGVIYECSPIADSATTTDEWQDYEIKLKLI